MNPTLKNLFASLGQWGADKSGTMGASHVEKLGRQLIKAGEPDMTAIRKRAIPELHAAARRLTELLADVDCEP